MSLGHDRKPGRQPGRCPGTQPSKNGRSSSTSARRRTSSAPLTGRWPFSNALLSFHPDTALAGDRELVVWPSNEQLIGARQRHASNDATAASGGLGRLRADHPQGQPERQALRAQGQAGEIEQAFGFDLAPIVARAEEFKDLAEAVRPRRRPSASQGSG